MREKKLMELIDLYTKLVNAERDCAGFNLSLSTLQNYYSETVFKICSKRKLNGDEIIGLNKRIKELRKKLKIDENEKTI